MHFLYLYFLCCNLCFCIMNMSSWVSAPDLLWCRMLIARKRKEKKRDCICIQAITLECKKKQKKKTIPVRYIGAGWNTLTQEGNVEIGNCWKEKREKNERGKQRWKNIWEIWWSCSGLRLLIGFKTCLGISSSLSYSNYIWLVICLLTHSSGSTVSETHHKKI